MRVLCLLLLLIAADGMGGAWASDASVRIGFLLNFSRFTEWPAATLSADRPVQFCLAPGDPEMAAEFASLERQMVRNRPVKTLQVTHPRDIERCQLLYLPVELAEPLAPWLAGARHAGALTISDRANFLDEGGMIGLTLNAGRYRFDINLVEVKLANLQINANLLKLANSIK